GKTAVHIHDLPGPTNKLVHDSMTMAWYHLTATQLDFSHFTKTCRDIVDLPERMQTLVQELSIKIDRHKKRSYAEGYFIEPGTVLRADEKCQPDPQSVIFSCIPYFDLQTMASKSGKTLKPRLSPPRTLLQSLYPDESVRERDSEQAYKKFGTSKSNKIVYVPSIWMMNIGWNIVVTCGHKTLDEEMVNSLKVVHEDLKQLRSTDITANTLTNIRLTDWIGRVHLYPLGMCRSYFQLEQRLKGLRRVSHDERNSKLLQVAWVNSGTVQLIKPGDWSSLVRRTDLIFLDIKALNTEDVLKLQPLAKTESMSPLPSIASADSFPPFFHWPMGSGAETSSPKAKLASPAISQLDHIAKRLDFVEKSMMNERLDIDDTTTEVDRAFASSAFYEGLSQAQHSQIMSQFQSLEPVPAQYDRSTQHEKVIGSQCDDMGLKAASFCKIVYTTTCLFVEDVDSSAILRKLWGAFASIHHIIADMQRRGIVLYGTPKVSSVLGHREKDMRSSAGWYVRTGKNAIAPRSEANEKLQRSIKRCGRCRSIRPFNSSQAAIDHLQQHLRSIAEPETVGEDLGGAVSQPNSTNTLGYNFEDWVIEEQQLRREGGNDDLLKILTQACSESYALLLQAKDLADGVKDEQGKLLELYTFPRQLIDSFRQLVVYYLAVERALHRTHSICLKENTMDDDNGREYNLPSLERGYVVPSVLKQFYKGAQQSLTIVRDDLCKIAKVDPPPDPMQDLSLSAPYVCGWLMRRLLVKPLEEQLTIGEMYRDYLSTIQFQVNHRPGKRLIRSINLLQEELQALIQVNTWQTKLIENYTRVVDDATCEKDVPHRRAMFPFERMLLRSCLDNLELHLEDYRELSRRCNPLSDRTKQSLEINEEDHGKAIMVFTIVTIIFLPLSFVTSYLGMNTIDIRDMGSGQSLFWTIAIPLTAVTMGAAMFIGYNGDDLRDKLSAILHPKKTAGTTGHKQGASRLNSTENVDSADVADNAEYASPLP
ncbi:hypothetical protein EK21DRAFT_33642, partial [Setomelanomma holmii]